MLTHRASDVKAEGPKACVFDRDSPSNERERLRRAGWTSVAFIHLMTIKTQPGHTEMHEVQSRQRHYNSAQWPRGSGRDPPAL
jgi:hypothetical protein